MVGLWSCTLILQHLHVTHQILGIYYFSTAWKVSKYGVISVLYFSVFGLNTEKYGPEITPYLDTFHAVLPVFKALSNLFLHSNVHLILQLFQGDIKFSLCPFWNFGSKTWFYANELFIKFIRNRLGVIYFYVVNNYLIEKEIVFVFIFTDSFFRYFPSISQVVFL